MIGAILGFIWGFITSLVPGLSPMILYPLAVGWGYGGVSFILASESVGVVGSSLELLVPVGTNPAIMGGMEKLIALGYGKRAAIESAAIQLGSFIMGIIAAIGGLVILQSNGIGDVGWISLGVWLMLMALTIIRIGGWITTLIVIMVIGAVGLVMSNQPMGFLGMSSAMFGFSFGFLGLMRRRRLVLPAQKERWVEWHPKLKPHFPLFQGWIAAITSSFLVGIPLSSVTAFWGAGQLEKFDELLRNLRFHACSRGFGSAFVVMLGIQGLANRDTGSGYLGVINLDINPWAASFLLLSGAIGMYVILEGGLIDWYCQVIAPHQRIGAFMACAMGGGTCIYLFGWWGLVLMGFGVSFQCLLRTTGLPRSITSVFLSVAPIWGVIQRI